MLITVLVLLCHFPPVLSAFLIIQLGLFFIAMLMASKFFIWLLGIFYLLLISVGKDVFMDTSRMTDEDRLISVLLAWFLIRCLDFALSEVKESNEQCQKFLNLLAYTFYLPCFFFGPFIPYEYFKLQIYKTRHAGYKERLLCLCISLVKYYIYYLLFEFLSHVLYCSAMHHIIENLVSNGLWTLSGIGICMANFFYLKYIVVYGFSTSIAMFENFTTPDLPKCIYRIHLYSKMWRHFDRGFYLFIFRCIYSPVCGRRHASIIKKSFASFLCFLFVYIWHGGTISVFYWSLFNFVGLLCEAICRQFWKNQFINRWLVTNLSQQNLRRLEAFVASPLWVFAVISNFMFFGGHKLGMLHFQQLLKGSLLLNISVVMIAYCMCQVSIETDKFEKKTSDKYLITHKVENVE
ncbi:protein-cysteine N-palmitoyltransferase Rasp isoform X2 [Halyomorpha halys]|nr:protein-cysteine N-palmitoyltransferase Rasp isoform X2 [Halyomorpha halys]XP_014280360.1 protein-cysteine N-palmitoyltransferase Rasp isoform X2 [Halyomorpha halys]